MSLFESEKIRRDMDGYRLITARESRTYEALLRAGIPRPYRSIGQLKLMLLFSTITAIKTPPKYAG